MKAHKVPATYYRGWKASGYNESFYVFYKNKLNEKGILKPFGKVDSITTEHSYFMEEDFYYIDFDIKGIIFKLPNEVNDFLNEKNFSIMCDDYLSDCELEDKHTIIIDNHRKFVTYMCYMDSWTIRDSHGQNVSKEDFNNELNKYIFDRVGVIIEEDYFAHYLEQMWPDIVNAVISDVSGLNSGEDVILSRKMDLLEFCVVQYLRLDKRIKTDITPKIKFFEKLFIEIGADSNLINEMKGDGLLTEDVYFFGILLDAARGDKLKINDKISHIDNNFVIDVLKTPSNFSYLTSTSPCIFSKVNNDTIEEMLFPISSNYCLRFRNKNTNIENGKYIVQALEEAKKINAYVISTSEDIVISEQECISTII